MYYLNIEFGNSFQYDFEGIYHFYTTDKNHIYQILDMLKLVMLRELSIEFDLCTCCYEETIDTKRNYPNNRIYKYIVPKTKCKHCMSDKQKDLLYLDFKDDYIFEIDVYEIRQCGFEERIRLQDFDTLLNYHYPKAKKNYGIESPLPFTYKIEKVPDEQFIHLNNKIFTIPFNKNLKEKVNKYENFIHFSKWN